MALASILSLLAGIALCCGYSEPTASTDTKAKALIVDQLSNIWPNEGFISEVTKELEDYGFDVYVYQGKDISVKFYRELPENGYKLIIFRAHSGVLKRAGGTYLFTDEAYSKTKYGLEQLTGQMLEVTITEDYPTVFAVNSRFIQNSINGEFQDAVIIMMGCSTTYMTDMAEAFAQKGASVYVGWCASVVLDYVDEATPSLITNLCTEDMTLEKALNQTMAEVGPDPDYHAYLKYHPASAGNKTLDELIR